MSFVDHSYSRLVILRVLVFSLFVALLGRLFVMQIVNGEEFKNQAADARFRSVVIPATRGVVLDQAGRTLIGNRRAMVVSVSLTDIEALGDRGKTVIKKLAPLIGIPVDELTAKLSVCGEKGAAKPPLCWNGSRFQPIPVAKDLALDVAVRIKERQHEFPGVIASMQTVRVFPEPLDVNLAHVLGYIGPVSDKELAERAGTDDELQSTDLVGRSGLERFYDAQLRGNPGVTTYAIDRTMAIIGKVSETAPTSGSYLVLGIDAAVQKVTEVELKKAINRARNQGFAGTSGAAVVMDVTNGQVVAMASYPTYDPRIWLDGVTAAEYKRLTDDAANSPLVSRAIQGLFAPASTFKVVTTAAAYRAKIPMGSTLYPCPSSIDIGNRKMTNHESRAYGNISVRRAIEVSCNTVFYKLGYDMWLRDGGNDPTKPQDFIEKMALKFGLGKKTGIDLPSEASGRVGGRAFKTSQYEQYKDVWCFRAKEGYPSVAKTDPARAAYLKLLAQENCTDGGKWRGGDAANLSIGQGDTSVTPLQMAVLYSAIANGGKLYQPRVVKAIVSPDGKTVKATKPKLKGKVYISPSLREYLLTSLRGVITDGTGKTPFANWPQGRLEVAAKTGSGENGDKDPTSWFASFAPADNPRYAVVMMVEQGGTGALTSGPGVRKIYEALYGIKGEKLKPKQAVIRNSRPAIKLPKVKSDGSVEAIDETKRIDQVIKNLYGLN